MSVTTTRGRVLGLLAIALVVALAYSPRIVFRDTVNVDAASYLSHALTIALDADLDYSNEPVINHWYNTATSMPSHPIGPGLLAAPFVALFGLIDRATGAAVLADHKQFAFSWSYFGFVFASTFYVLVGMWLYAQATRVLAPRLDRRWVILLSASFGMLYYALQSAEMPHTYEFFAFALAFWGSVKAWSALVKGDRSLAYLAWAGLGIALAYLVRPANLNAVLLPPAVAFAMSVHPRWHVPDRSIWRRFLASYSAVIAVTIGSVALLNVQLYGAAFPTPAVMYGKFMPIRDVFAAVAGPGSGGGGEAAFWGAIVKVIGLSGNSLLVLFSSEFGVLYTAPILLFGTIMLGAFLLRPISQQVVNRLGALTLAVAFVGLPAAIVLYWQSTASNYGYRYLFSVYPLAFMGFALWYGRIRESGLPLAPLAMASVWSLTALSAFAIASQWFWGTSDSLHYFNGENVFGRHTQYGAKGYVTNLLAALAEPRAWLSMLAHRFPGFLGAIGLDVLGIDLGSVGSRLGIPADRLGAGIARYTGAPPVAIAQTLLLYLAAVIGSWWIAFRPVGASPGNTSAASQ